MSSSELDFQVDMALTTLDLDAAQKEIESAQHIHQQLQADICPECVDGVRVIVEASRTYNEGCIYCGGTGKRSAV
jgi:hypothetical protein